MLAYHQWIFDSCRSDSVDILTAASVLVSSISSYPGNNRYILIKQGVLELSYNLGCLREWALKNLRFSLERNSVHLFGRFNCKPHKFDLQ